jgi:geranyl-CoA carboxylase alpha subunit
VRKLVIANRGEIAVRIARTARRMGIATVAVFSDADRNALHVRACDEAVRIGPASAAQSYLNIDAILDAARRSGADAVHPGYGFLSENAGFADCVRAAGLAFVGPSGDAIRLMGDKAAAKAAMRAAGVPVIAGYDGMEQGDTALAVEADRIGFPLLVKARAGGGGRGMRIVRGPGAFKEALASARREAKAAFGDDRVLLEKLVEGGRHVEVQVFGDRHGNAVHLFERDCTAQRRRQKVIEEAPSPHVDAALRERLGNWAVAATKAAKYEGAGTVEFILDGDGSPFFLEMNTRLQVEHPVTEMVTGLDLVEWQLRIADGEPLPLAQEQIVRHGHAIEARLYAEDPERGFLAQTGVVARFRPDTRGQPNLRVDAGVGEGQEISVHYDAMIAKFVAHGRDREEARRALAALIGETPVGGLATNAGFLCRLLQSEEFAQSRMTVATLDEWQESGHVVFRAPNGGSRDFAEAAAALALAAGGSWFRSTGMAEHPVDLARRGEARTATLVFVRGALRKILVGGEAFALEQAAMRDGVLEFVSDGIARRRRAICEGGEISLQTDGDWLAFREPDLLAAKIAPADPRHIVAPAAGLIVKVMARAGQRIAAGDKIAAIEAMKMETTLTATASGAVLAIHCKEGDRMEKGDLLAEIEPDGQANG